jgi:uncharacterized membrane protein
MKKILLVLAGIIVVIVAGIAALIFVTPTGFKVEREIEINKPKAEVFAYVRNLKAQEKWGPWLKKDPTTKLMYSGTDGEVGSTSGWESNNAEVGSGEQEITKIVDGERIEIAIRFKKPFESNADSYMNIADSGDGKTKVQWGFASSMPRPMNLMLLFIDMNEEVGKDFSAGLQNLKEILEKAPATAVAPADSKEDPVPESSEPPAAAPKTEPETAETPAQKDPQGTDF